MLLVWLVYGLQALVLVVVVQIAVTRLGRWWRSRRRSGRLLSTVKTSALPATETTRSEEEP